jgi:hypothetical protein
MHVTAEMQRRAFMGGQNWYFALKNRAMMAKEQMARQAVATMPGD